MDIAETKICTKCGEEKVLGEFYKDKRASDGRTSSCKQCRRDYQSQRRKNFPEKFKERDRNNRKKFATKIRARWKKWYRKNRERQKIKQREYRTKNREKINQTMRRWVKNNQEKVRSYREKTNSLASTKISKKKWRERNQEKIKAYIKKKILYLDNGYVARCLCDKTILKTKDIPQELIELKKVQIKFRRHERNLKNGKTTEKKHEGARGKSRRRAG